MLHVTSAMTNDLRTSAKQTDIGMCSDKVFSYTPPMQLNTIAGAMAVNPTQDIFPKHIGPLG